MSKRTVPDLKELFKQAAEIAQQVPESMQEAAFNRAIDLLTGETQLKSDIEGPGTKREESRGNKPNDKIKMENSSPDDLLASIDSTKHPGVTSASKVLDQSLMVLQIALRDHSVDGLTPSTISTILTEKFRINTNKNSVNMALGRATNLVNRFLDGHSFIYKIMSPGEEHLAHIGESKSSSHVAQPKKTLKKKQAKIKKPQKPKNTNSIQKKRTISEGGAVATLTQLSEEDFFATPKTINDFIQHCDTNLARKFKANDISGKLARMVRNGELTREKNADNQYEYKKS